MGVTVPEQAVTAVPGVVVPVVVAVVVTAVVVTAVLAVVVAAAVVAVVGVALVRTVGGRRRLALGLVAVADLAGGGGRLLVARPVVVVVGCRSAVFKQLGGPGPVQSVRGPGRAPRLLRHAGPGDVVG